MSKQSAEALRASRKARLDARNKAKTAAASATQSQSSITDDEGTQKPSEDPPKQSKAASAPQQAPRELVAKVVDPTKVEQGAEITLAGPFNAKTDNPHWIVIVDGDPIAKVALADQDEPNSIRRVFATPEYADSLIGTAKQMPLMQLLTGIHARPYVAAVRSSEAFEALDQHYMEQAKVAFQKKAATYRDEFLTVLHLVAEAQRKNFIPSNPLKDAFFKHMKKVGVNDPVVVIESAWEEGAREHFEGMFDQAAKWMDYKPEALADIKASVTEMGVREVRAIVGPSAEISQQRLVPSANANVPVVSNGSGFDPAREAKTEKQTVGQKFAFRHRMLQNKLSPKG